MMMVVSRYESHFLSSGVLIIQFGIDVYFSTVCVLLNSMSSYCVCF